MPYSTRHRGLGQPDCPICGGLGYFSPELSDEHPDFGKAVVCTCRQQEAYEDRIKKLSEAGGLSSLADKRLENFSTEGIGLSETELSSLQAALTAAETYASNPQGWLLIRGLYGCGKTHLAAAIANRRLEMGYEALFVNVPDLLDHLRATYSSGVTEGYDQRFEQVRNAPLLIMDDLGAESPTNWAVEKLYQIFNHRYNARMPTVVTTNHDIEELEQRLRSRLVDPDISQTVMVNARDYRMGGAPTTSSDLSSLEIYHRMRFDTFNLRQHELLPPDAENLQNAFNYSVDFAREPHGWLVFSGGFAVGKTHLAAAIANARLEMAERVLFVTVPDLLDHLRATYSPESRVSYDKRFAEVRNTPLLVLDDLGMESATPWAREKLYQIFNYRYTAQMPTVITTAHRMGELNKTDPRLANRMLNKDMCRFFAMVVSPYNVPRK